MSNLTYLADPSRRRLTVSGAEAKAILEQLNTLGVFQVDHDLVTMAAKFRVGPLLVEIEGPIIWLSSDNSPAILYWAPGQYSELIEGLTELSKDRVTVA